MIKVLIIDDSAVVRKHLAEMLVAGGCEVIGAAPDPIFARQRMAVQWPDVIVLDVEMPRMDGITFLEQLMIERPTPVVMCSTLTEKGAATTMQALASGAVGFVTKPRLGLKAFLEDRANGIVAAVRAAAKANMRALPPPSNAPARPAPGAPKMQAQFASGPRPGVPLRGTRAMASTTDRVAAIGLSTGGVQTIEVVLRQLERTAPGIVIVQHMPASFTASLAARLNTVCALEVAEARDGDRVISGRALIAPGGRHMRLRRNGAQYVTEVFDAPVFNHHRPSVDVLFKSVAQCAGANASGLIMTGMGDDGARGLLEMRHAGARTAAQDEESSIVFGMPAEAIRLGGAESVLPLDMVAAWLMKDALR